MMSVEQLPVEQHEDECKPWCSPKHYRFCGGPCCPHLHPADELTTRPADEYGDGGKVAP
ncbi:hypothetical protein EV643_12056 [Kribbella sp. VKM Ac-2527]|uniref:Uncharacterized protein n=1 Tax=Kribbella caucasensis TaxID=2512215 RepID=A0A4R6JNY0_9ACTN|nr:hypothetical protein EV643_12056 [Kribbella sp. VKM Ac-2527]